MAMEYNKLSGEAIIDLLNVYKGKDGIKLVDEEILASPEFAEWINKELEIIESYVASRFDESVKDGKINAANYEEFRNNEDYYRDYIESEIAISATSAEYNEFREKYLEGRDPAMNDQEIENILESIGGYEAKSLEDFKITPEGLRKMAEDGRLDDLTPEQLVAAQGYVKSLGGGNGELAKENEIEEINLEQAKQKLKNPDGLSIGELASIYKAIDKVSAQGGVDAEHAQIRDLMRKAVENVASGKAEVGRDTKAMKLILDSNVAMRSTNAYKDADAKLFEAGQQINLDNEFIKKFNAHESKILEAFSKGEISLEEVADYPILREFIGNCDNKAHTAEEIKAAKEKLAGVVKDYDQANGLSDVTKEILEANTAKIDEIETSFDPFKVDETKDVPVPEIEVITFAQAQEKLKNPAALSIGDLAAIDMAVQAEMKAGRPIDAEHAQIRTLMRDAIDGVSKGKVKIGKDVKAMDHILKANVALMTSDAYGKADDKRREALKEIQDNKPLVDEEFTALRDTMKAMDFRGDMGVMGRKKLNSKAQDEVQESIMDAAKLKARQSLLGKKDGVSEEDWKNALKDSLHEVLYEVYAADQAAKGNTNPEKIAEGFAKLADMGAKGKKVKINRDSVIGVMAAREHQARNFATRLGQKVGQTPAVAKFKDRVKTFDDKCSKRFGKKYGKAKGAVKWIGKAAWGAAKSYGIYAVAASLAPVGIPALMAYNMGKAAVNLRKDYLGKKEKNPDLKLKDFWKSRDALVGMGGVALSALAAAVPAMQFADGLGIESVGDLAKQNWVKLANAGRPIASFVMAAGPKTFDALTAKKEDRKQKWAEALGAMGGVVTGYFMYGAIGDAVSAVTPEPAANATVDAVTGAAIVHEVNEGPEYQYDKDNPAATIVHHDPNQEAFEKGEMDADNAKAREDAARAQEEAAKEETVKTDPEVVKEETAPVKGNPEAVIDNDIAAEVVLPEVVIVADAPAQENVAEQDNKIIHTDRGVFEGEDIVKRSPEGDFVVDMSTTGVKLQYAIEDGEIKTFGDTVVPRNEILEAAIIEAAPREDGRINLDGVRSANPDMLLNDPRISADIKNIQIMDAIYTDMQEREQLGHTLSDVEKEFMQHHDKELAKYGVTHADINVKDELGDQMRAESLKDNQVKTDEPQAKSELKEGKDPETKPLTAKEKIEALQHGQTVSEASAQSQPKTVAMNTDSVKSIPLNRPDTARRA